VAGSGGGGGVLEDAIAFSRLFDDDALRTGFAPFLPFQAEAQRTAKLAKLAAWCSPCRTLWALFVVVGPQ
jgi:hypothetical protein